MSLPGPGKTLTALAVLVSFALIGRIILADVNCHGQAQKTKTEVKVRELEPAHRVDTDLSPSLPQLPQAQVQPQVQAVPRVSRGSSAVNTFMMLELMEQEMDRAAEDPEAARSLFGKLEQCLGSDGEFNPAMLLCLENAKAIAEHYPEFRERYQKLKNSLPDEVRAELGN